MPIIVEDGTIVPNANSYADRAAYIEYAAQRGYAVPDDDTADVDLINAMDFVETQRFIGERVQTGLPRLPYDEILPEQPCQWPRFGLYVNDDLPTTVYEIPAAVKRGQCQVALDIRNGFKPFVNTPAGPRVSSEKLGPLSRTYAQDQRTITLMPLALSLLRPVLVGSAFFGATTYRA